MFTHLVPPTRTISQSSLYPQDLAQCLAWNKQVKSQLNEGTINTTSHMALLPPLSGLPSPSSTLLLSLHCKIIPKVFIASKTSTPCVPPSLSFLKHILHPIAQQMLSEFLACIQHLFIEHMVLWALGIQKGTMSASPTFQSIGKRQERPSV